MKKSTKSFTANETFIDTSGFFSLMSLDDSMHKRCRQLMLQAQKQGQRFVTSDYVLDEAVTLLKARKLAHLLQPFFALVDSAESLRIEWMDPDLFDQTKRLLLKHHDKNWSFTDCSSFCLMRSLRIHDALTKDEHFLQAGFNPLLV